jgi:hypothetical protein
MGLGAREIVLSSAAASALKKLESGDVQGGVTVARRVRSLRAILLSDILHGEVVKKDSIPRRIHLEYGAENLYVGDLPSFWRLLYTVVHIGEERHIVVLEIVDHPTYDKWFPGRRRR